MCGGTLDVNEGDKITMCAYCGNRQTVPTVYDDAVANQFNRANNLRMRNEFDKAAETYSKILDVDDKISEAHWGLLLCKYGIEYVEDPKTYKRIPTCHRTQYTSVLSDADYLAAIENADADSREVYVAQAHEIAELQKSILAIVKDEQPFDVFICYKETDEYGKRTVDSALANDIYYQLTKEGLRVFYSAITLEDKLGVEYEPYIFAALNSAKVMLVIGTKLEYFNAVWVRNEWSRYLSIMKTDRDKLLIPCYRDLDAYDLPEEFAHLQAHDMSKIGFINDLVRGIKKVVVKAEPEKEVVVKEVVKESKASESGFSASSLLKRAFLFLEDAEWQNANEFAEVVLNSDPECAEAYLVKLMCAFGCRKRENIKDCSYPFDKDNNYQKLMRFGSAELKSELQNCIRQINDRNEQIRLGGIYDAAFYLMRNARDEFQFTEAANQFATIAGFGNSAKLRDECLAKAEAIKKDAVYMEAHKILNDPYDYPGKEGYLYESIKAFDSLGNWRDSRDKSLLCRKMINEIRAKEEQERLEAERKANLARELAKKRSIRRKRTAVAITLLICIIVVVSIFLNTVVIPDKDYKKATELMAEGKKLEAAMIFGSLEDYKDAQEKSLELWNEFAHRATISAGDENTAAILYDGTVVAVGNDENGCCDVSSWSDIVSVSVGSGHIVGLKSDGTVVAAGANDDGQCKVDDLTDIVSVSAGNGYTLALKSDGTVVAKGSRLYGQSKINSWNELVAVSAGEDFAIGLKSDGTVVGSSNLFLGMNKLETWSDIVDISSGYNHMVGLQKDGLVVATGDNEYGKCDVSHWYDIVDVSAGYDHTVGLRNDGTVVAVGNNNCGQLDVEEWYGIVAISAGAEYTVGLRYDGTVVAVGNWDSGRCDVENWSGVRLP